MYLQHEARFWLPYSSPRPPLMALDKVREPASWLVQDPASLREGGPNTCSSSPFSSSPGQEQFLQNDVVTNKKTACSAAELLTWVSRRLQLRPTSSMVSGHFIRDPKNNRYIPLSITPKKCRMVRGPSGLNSHIQRDRCWHGRTRRSSIT